MDKKLKYGIIAAGGVAIVGIMFLRGSGGGDGTRPDPDNVLDARVIMNQAAMQMRTMAAENAADIVMNRDRVTGATTIASINMIGGALASNNDLTGRLNESYAGIVKSRIASQTAIALEASRASVAKYIAKKQAKAAKHNADMGFFSDLGGNLLKAVPSIVSAFA